MKKTVIFVFIILAAIIALLFYSKHVNAPDKAPVIPGTEEADEQKTDETTSVLPWVEVLAGTASVKSGEVWTPLSSGDEIAAEANVKTNVNSLVVMHMPDGSVVRLDENSEIVLGESDYDKDTETMKTKIFLVIGRAWSKIFELATPESYWEVETSNAVAAVRGTSFGVEFVDGQTTVIGAEHAVNVSALESPAGRALATTALGEGKIIRVNNQIMARVAAKQSDLADEIRVVPENLKISSWVKRAAASDMIWRERVEEMRDQGMANIEIRRAIRLESLSLRQEILRIRQSQSAQPVGDASDAIRPAETRTENQEPAVDSAVGGRVDGITNTEDMDQSAGKVISQPVVDTDATDSLNSRIDGTTIDNPTIINLPVDDSSNVATSVTTDDPSDSFSKNTVTSESSLPVLDNTLILRTTINTSTSNLLSPLTVLR